MSAPQSNRYVLPDLPATIMAVLVQKAFTATTEAPDDVRVEYEVTLWGQPSGGGKELHKLIKSIAGRMEDNYMHGPGRQYSVRARFKKPEGVIGFLGTLTGRGYITHLQLNEIRDKFNLNSDRGPGFTEGL